jgi:membrane-anchored protein YejM (alkaline phosphatase superfamily)
LITLDTQRADHISAYSTEYASTPNIDLLAQKGTLFKNCWSLIPITLPAHGAIFFSQPPHVFKSYNNGQKIYPQKDRPSLVTLFKKRGFQTAAFVSLGVLKSDFGLREGFDVYSDKFPKGRWYLAAEEVNQRLFPWLEQNKDRPFFLWVHYSDPHEPYAPPDSPPDLKLFMNGQFVDDYYLNKFITYEVELDLKPGYNQLRWEIENEYMKRRENYKGRLDKLEFTPSPDTEGFEIKFEHGWYIRRDINTLYFMNPSSISFKNTGGFRKAKIIFRGKPILTVEGAREHYKKEVEYMDRAIGELWKKLDALGLSDKTAILMVGDHGEGLGEHSNDMGSRHIGHIHYLYEVYMRVPLIIFSPFSSAKGVTREEPVTIGDIAPTIASLMGIGRVKNFQGRDLVKLKNGETTTVFEETYKPESVRDRFALLDYPWHLISTPQDNRYQLFNIEKDPLERENIYLSPLPPEVVPLKQKLDERSRTILKNKIDQKVDKKTEEMLKALGYVKGKS